MKKYLIIALILIILCVIGFLTVFLTSRTVNDEPEMPPDPFAGTVSPSAAPSKRISISTNDGGQIEVQDFIGSNQPIDAESGTYYNLVHPDPSYAGGGEERFAIQYDADLSFFLITLQEEPLTESRLAAQAFLMNRLQIQSAQLCRLNAQVFATAEANELYSDRGDLGFSVCNGAQKLPGE